MTHTPGTTQDNSQASFEKWGTAILIIVGFLLFFVILCMVYLPNMADRVDIDQVNERKKKLSEMRAHEQKELTHYAWVDKANGVVQIPVPLAMDLTVRDLSKSTAAQSSQSTVQPSAQ